MSKNVIKWVGLHTGDRNNPLSVGFDPKDKIMIDAEAVSQDLSTTKYALTCIQTMRGIFTPEEIKMISEGVLVVKLVASNPNTSVEGNH